jgi:Tol biopolymer transport system component
MNASKGKQMRPLVIALAASLVLAVAACGGNDGAKSAGPVATVTVQSDPAAPAASPASVAGVPEVHYLIDLDTGEMTALPEAIIRPLGGNSRPSRQYAASSDGSRLAFVVGDAHPQVLYMRSVVGQIFVAGIDGTGVRQVTADPKGASWPAWSPDGTRIAYVRSDRKLTVLDLATGESTQILNVNAISAGLQFTPDGSSLLYSGASGELRTVPVGGGESTLLIGADGDLVDAFGGSLSPDGSLVTYLGSWSDHGPAGWVANVDGTDRRDIPCDTLNHNPAGTWSPDSSRIVCTGPGDGVVSVVDVATGLGSPVADGRRAIWLDGHTLLVEVPIGYCSTCSG